ncbi:unnamed protein product, partial [marine sediment metagenome]
DLIKDGFLPLARLEAQFNVKSTVIDMRPVMLLFISCRSISVND